MNFLQKYGFLSFAVVLVFVTLYFANYGTNINEVKVQVDASFYIVEAVCILVYLLAHFFYDHLSEEILNSKWFLFFVIVAPALLTMWNCTRFEPPIFK